MQSRNICKLTRAFTLVELLIVLAIVTMLFSLGLIFSMGSYQSFARQSQRDVLLSALMRARSESMANVGGTTHGVCWTPAGYIVFAGSVCVSSVENAEIFPTTPSVSVSGLEQSNPVVFEQVSGNLLPQLVLGEERVIQFSENGKSSEISINNEGTINW